MTPPSGLVAAVYTQTEGNPLFVTEIVRLLVQEGSVGAGLKATTAVGGNDSWTIRIPEGVREVIGRRLNRLSQRCNEALTVASIVGREFTLAQLRPLVDEVSEDRLFEVLEEALSARVIEELPQAVGRYQFTHALIQETLAGELSTTRRVRLHARIAAALEELYGTELDAHAAELAHHFAEAEAVLGPEKLVRYSLVAGDRALGGYAFEEGLAHFERGLAAKGIEMTSSQPAPDQETAGLLFGLGRARLATGRRITLSEAIADLRRAFDYYAAAGDTGRAVAVGQHRLPNAVGMLTGASELIQRALELVEAGSHDEGLLLAQYITIGYYEENDVEAARDSYARALAIAERENDIDLQLLTLVQASNLETFHCDFQKSVALSLQGVELAQGVDNPQAEIMVYRWAGISQIFSGDLHAAKPHLAKARDLAETLRDQNSLSGYWASALWAFLEGDFEEARRFSDRSLTDITDCRALGIRITLELELGDFEHADVYMERLLETMRLSPPGPVFEYMIPAVALPMAARIRDDTNGFEAAEAAADAVLNSANPFPFVVGAARAGLGLLAVKRGDPAVAADLHASLISHSGTIMIPNGLVYDRVLGLLAQTMGEPDQAAKHFEVALAFSRKGGYRTELAWACCDYADLLLDPSTSSGRTGSDGRALATSLLDESLSISSELGMRPLMERVLSRREILKA